MNELYAWANEGNRKLEHKLRMTQQRYFTTKYDSTDAATYLINGINYVPSVSLKFGANTNYATLPPDFQELIVLRFVDSTYQQVPLTRLAVNSRDFRDVLNATIIPQNPGTHMFYDIIGERQIIFVPQVNVAMDVEVTYVARQKRLFSYSTGTVASVDATTAVTGVGTYWKTWAPFDSSYLDICFGASGVATVPTPEPQYVYDGINLARVSAIGTDTGLTLAANKIGTLVAGTGYLLSAVPVLPEDYHSMIADYVGFRILAKANDPGAQRAMDGWQDAIADLLTTSARRATSDHEVIEDWNPWSY